MNDPRPAGGRKQSPNNPRSPEQDQSPRTDQSETPHPAGHDPKKADRPKDDPSEAPESGDRKATGNS